MTIHLPKPIATFFAADRTRDPERVAACFTETAIVTDEGRTYHGRDEIRQWIAESSAKYTYTATPFNVNEEDGRTVVTAHLIGNFPGSPVDLRYVFALEGELIAELKTRI